MSVPEAVDEPAADPHKGKTMTFRKTQRRLFEKPTPEQARRQDPRPTIGLVDDAPLGMHGEFHRCY